MKRLLGLMVALLLPQFAYSWSSPGHQAVAEAALAMVSPATKAKVMAILGNQTPAAAATWLDDLRENRVRDPQFSHNFPGNSGWHFVDFPVDSPKYVLNSRFASKDDVVHALENAIKALEGRQSTMTKKEALDVIIHLVGDIHQPLHCETGFYDLSDLDHPHLLQTIGDPKTTPQDRGGNQLYYTKSLELHAMWDKTIPALIAKDPDVLATKIEVANFGAQPLTPGNYHKWPEKWASESMQQASEAYKGIVFKSASYVPNTRHPGTKMLKIVIELPGGSKGYAQAQKSRAQTQLTRAAVRLAQLLESIKYN